MPSVLSTIADYLPAAAIILLPNVGGTLSSFLTRGEPRWEWYRSLKKPSLNPPNWVFGPVWDRDICLYGCILLPDIQGGWVCSTVLASGPVWCTATAQLGVVANIL